MKIEDKSKLLFIGDSITDCGRARPVGEGRGDAYGNGYVALINAWFGAVHPNKQIRIINMGTSGNTVKDIKQRWQTDVFDIKPDWISIMIGINDVWRQFDLPLQTERHVLLEEYSYILEDLVKNTIQKVDGIILMTPYLIEPNKNEPMRSMMDTYGNAVKNIANKYKTLFIDTQEAFDKVLKHIHPMAIAWDRVHPNLAGHMIIMNAFIEKIRG